MCLAQHTWGPCLVPARLVRRAWVSHASPFALRLVRRMWARPSLQAPSSPPSDTFLLGTSGTAKMMISTHYGKAVQLYDVPRTSISD